MSVEQKTPKGRATAAHILETALELFREDGFEATSMRDIATASGKSLGAAYHYFASKDAIVAAYFEHTQFEHERRMAGFADASVAEHVTAAINTKLDIVERDRKLLAAQLATLASPDHSLSLFASTTQDLRTRSIAVFARAFGSSALDAATQQLAAYAAWLLHLGVLLYFVHDDSEHAAKTRRLATAMGTTLGQVAPLAATPFARPFIEQAIGLARELGIDDI